MLGELVLAINDDQVEFLDYFCDERHKFDYAVMIDAPWGSGKTYFLREYLKQKYPPSTTEPPEPPDYLWVSLFGRTNAAEVRDALFAEAHPMLSSKWGALAGSVGAGLFKKVSGIDLGDKQLTKQFLPDIKAKLIVFDDLERSTIGPTNALGLINSFVESGTFKVIVIANQKPFAGENDYRSQKEKVIGRTLTVTSDPDAVLSELTKSLRNDSARNAVTANRDDILAVFRSSGYHNFRSLRAALDDFDRLVAKSDVRLGTSPAALRELVVYLVAIGMEVRADAVQGDNLEELLGAATRLRVASKADQKVVEAKGLISKYPNVAWESPIISPGILGQLITGGVLPLQEINEGLAVHRLIVGAAKVPAWLALWRWIDLNANEYSMVRKVVLEQLSKRSIVRPGEILHLVGTMIWIEEFGDRIVGNVGPYFIAYINNLLRDGKLEPEMSVFDASNFEGWASIGYQKSEHPTFQRVQAHLKNAVESAHKQLMVESAKQLLVRLSAPGFENALYEFDRKRGEYGGVALLHHLSPVEFADLLVKDNLYVGKLIVALKSRYALGYGTPDLIEEKQWLVDLEADIRKKAMSATPPHRRLLEKRTDYYFDDIRKSMAMLEALAANRNASSTPETLVSMQP